MLFSFCKVCENVINQLSARVADDAKPEEIEAEFKEFCKTAKGRDEKFVSLFTCSSFFSTKFLIVMQFSSATMWEVSRHRRLTSYQRCRSR